MTIELNDITYRYKSALGDPALQGVTTTIEPGIHLLLGENGAGKTTLLHVIAGLLFPKEGTCKIDGAKTRFRLPSIMHNVFLSGVNISYPAVSIAEMVKIHAPFYPTFDPEALARNLAAFGMDGTEKLASLSTGNAQKAKVAYALALRTRILLLDEPANGLDIESKKTLQRIIAESVDPEQTVIISTHSVRDLENFYDGVIDLSHGELQYAMSVEEIQKRIIFAITDSKPDNAIYGEQRIGLYHSVIANSDSDWSDIDYELLYMAARKAPEKLLKALTK